MGSTELPSLITSFTVQKALKSKAFIFLINQLAINLTWSELTTEPHINCYEVCLKFHLVWLFIHFVVETFCCQMLPLTSHEYYAMHMVYSFYYPTEMWKAVKRDLEALKGMTAWIISTVHMSGSLNLEVFAFKSNPKNVTPNKAVRNKICLHYVKMIKLMGKEKKTTCNFIDTNRNSKLASSWLSELIACNQLLRELLAKWFLFWNLP